MARPTTRVTIMRRIGDGAAAVNLSIPTTMTAEEAKRVVRQFIAAAHEVENVATAIERPQAEGSTVGDAS